MKQFTSHIDFSLTRKRFKMMLKEFSVVRSGSKGILLLLVLLISTLMFCTQQPDYPLNITENSDELYSNIKLFVNPSKSDELKIEKWGMGIRYDSEGSPYTGTQEFRYVKNDSLFSEVVYENGIMKSSVGYDEKGNALDQFEYGYIGDQYQMIKHVKPNGMIVEEWQDVSSGELGYHKKWHDSGKLKYEAYFKSNIKYEGLMTMYDENGKIIQLERYENGELVEILK